MTPLNKILLLCFASFLIAVVDAENSLRGKVDIELRNNKIITNNNNYNSIDAKENDNKKIIEEIESIEEIEEIESSSTTTSSLSLFESMTIKLDHIVSRKTQNVDEENGGNDGEEENIKNATAEFFDFSSWSWVKWVLAVLVVGGAMGCCCICACCLGCCAICG
jgi:23S rRNA pseudoU1915 N3-methylase RlmH